jgi:acyl-CoA thioesterase FadM
MADGRLLAEGNVKLAALNSSGQVVGLPSQLRATLEAL